MLAKQHWFPVSGNVAIYAVEKAQAKGMNVVAMSDSNGYIYDPKGIKLDIIKDIKEVRRGRIKEYAERMIAEVQSEVPGYIVTAYFSYGQYNLGSVHAESDFTGSNFDAAGVWIK